MRQKTLIPIFLLIAVILFSGQPAARAAGSGAQQAPADSVALFSKKDCGGDFRSFGPGEYPDVSFRSASIYIPSDCTVTAYSKKDFTGERYEFTETQSSYFRYDFGTGITRIRGIRSMIVHEIKSEGFRTPSLDDKTKNNIMTRYAPRIYMAADDPYEACSMEYVFEHFERSVDKNGEGRISTVAQPSSPFDILPVYYGRQEDAKAYAFWIDKEDGYTDVSYFQFCPFDSGKYIKLIKRMAGAHPGDWEHLTIRFKKYRQNGADYMRPVKVAFPAHTFAAQESWETLDKIGKTHIEVYCAAGTHGMYPSPGEHVYLDLGPIQKLTDVCSAGEPWDLWKNDRLETFEHDPETGSRALNGSPWAHLFGYDKGEDSLSVRSWGNKTFFPIFLGGGPDGPQYKTELHSRATFK